MKKEEFNYMSKCLLETITNIGNAKTIHEVYYQKGIIKTLEDIIYKFADDYMINEINHKLINIKNEF